MLMKQLTGGTVGGGSQFYTETTTYGNKTITCGFEPKVIIVNRSDSSGYYGYGCVYAEENVTGSPAQKSIGDTASWIALGGTGYTCIDSVTDTGFVMKTGNTAACTIFAWG